jgi:hypothetical protein
VQLHLIVSFVSLRLGHASQGRDGERVRRRQVAGYWPDDQFWVSGREEVVTWKRKEKEGHDPDGSRHELYRAPTTETARPTRRIGVWGTQIRQLWVCKHKR